MRSWKRAAAIVAGIGGIVAGAAPAWATSFVITGTGLDPTPGGLWGTIRHAGLPNGQEVAGIGRIQLTGTGPDGAVTFESYCVDIFDWLGGGTFTTADLSTLPFSGAQLRTLRTFLVNADPLVSGGSAVMSAAAQLGAWEILNESAGNGYDLTAGAFSASGGNLTGNGYDALALANDWLARVEDRRWTANAGGKLALITPAGGNQPQVYLTAGGSQGIGPAAAVPEPASWAMMIMGFGAVGAGLRRRRATVAFA
jgi:hypothetical protein